MQVFVSSTSVDLSKHRDVLSRVLRQAGMTPIEMETFGSRPNSALAESLAEVERADAFIGVYAHRYGSMPANGAPSISEAEYHRACAVGVPAFIYLIDPDHPWPDEHRDAGSSGALLSAFKAHLLQAHIVTSFREPHDLAASVAADLHRHWSRRGLVDIREANPRTAAKAQRFTSQSLQIVAGDPADWNKRRFGVYERQRNVFLHYELEPSDTEGQSFDITLHLVRKSNGWKGLARDDLHDVTHTDFFFGEMWGNKVFRVFKQDGRVGMVLAAYGELLAYCRVYFSDGYACDMHQFIRFPII